MDNMSLNNVARELSVAIVAATIVASINLTDVVSIPNEWKIIISGAGGAIILIAFVIVGYRVVEGGEEMTEQEYDIPDEVLDALDEETLKALFEDNFDRVDSDNISNNDVLDIIVRKIEELKSIDESIEEYLRENELV